MSWISTDYVKSDTLVGDSSHPSASVLAEIVKPNIPVKNGVVHLIQNPLMVVDTTVQEFIQVSLSHSPSSLLLFFFFLRHHSRKKTRFQEDWEGMFSERYGLTDRMVLLLKLQTNLI